MSDTKRLLEAIRLDQAGRVGEAERLCNSILAEDPLHPGAIHTLGLVAYHTRRSELALKLFKRAITIDPTVPDFFANCGCVLGHMGMSDDSVELLLHAIRLKPDYAAAYQNLGVAYEAQGKFDEALAAHGEALRLDPAMPEAHVNTANVLLKLGRLEEAAAAARRSVDLSPGFRAGWLSLAEIFKERGDVNESVACCRRAVLAAPECPAAHGALLSVLPYDPGTTPRVRHDESLRWEARHGKLGRAPAPYDNDGDACRRIRVAYLSRDLSDHPVGRWLWTALRERDRNGFEVICYSDSHNVDETTYKLGQLADGWRNVAHMSNQELIEQIRHDRADLLVDLSGAWSPSRLNVMGARPAPVQVSLCGHPGTTGLRTVDYRITDEHSDPPGLAESFYTERLTRLPDCVTCYHPPEPTPPVGTLPFSAVGRITFASLNRPVKINEQVVAAWAAILERVSDSRLLLLSAAPADPFLRSEFARQGVDPDRILMAERRQRAQYLELYQFADLALDPFPYNGDATTCDALWMGVPVVSLIGDSFVSRRGVSHLTNIGLKELLASDRDAYIELAVDLALDRTRLASLRTNLRERMLASPIADVSKYVKSLEGTYRNLWAHWCAQLAE